MHNKFHLGLSTSGHDPAFAVVNSEGKVIFAESTERFVQQKRAWGMDPDHPEHIRTRLADIIDPEAQVQIARTWSKSKKDLPINISGDFVIDDASVKWLVDLQDKAFHTAGNNLKHLFGSNRITKKHAFDHHLCHAVNACYSTSVESAICVVIDGEGEVGAASIYRLKDRELKRISRSWGPGSLGSYYGWLTGLCGFDWRRGEEWKVMGLAAFGSPVDALLEDLKKMVQVKDGKLLFPSENDLREIIRSAKSHGRKPEDDIMLAADLATTGQQAFSYFADEILKHCEQYDESNLILSGGCALNSSYNGTISSRMAFDTVHVPSAPADDGNAIGAALLSWMKDTNTNKIPFFNGSPFLGQDAKASLNRIKNVSKYGPFNVRELGENTSKELAAKLFEGKAIGVMRGRAEFGPRALGNRSILADPRALHMKDYINNEIKGREAYRPFAPVVPEQLVKRYFTKDLSSPYMSFTLPWKAEMKALVPAVVHADGTGRLQTVSPENNPWMSALLEDFGALSGIPIVLNTSFNVMGKPIVDTVDDALVVLNTSGLDAVLINNTLIEK